MQKVNQQRLSLALGLGALGMVAVLGVVAAYLFISPPQTRTVVFYTEDSASVHPGDTVRVAGVTIGKVRDLAIEQHQVRVRATIDNDIFVGDQSQVQVRMLTVVGGYYVNIIPLGDGDLGNRPIPVERVTMPYSLVRTLTDATKITDNVRARPIKESVDQLQHGLDGTNVESLSAILDAGNTLTSTIERQRGQLSQILRMSNEYVGALANYTDRLKDLVGKVALIEQMLTIYSSGFAAAWKGLGDAGDRLGPLGTAYVNHREKFLQKVVDWQEVFRLWAERSGAMVQWLRGQRDWMERILDSQNAPPELLATDVCIPVAGSVC
ncbi:Mce family protein [Mycobacteroides abscessus subsp. bolletii]|uniref:MlaD family protein n=1 Tax=Mycobacteroides abscessus TaxID=36809 RepID=UPI00092A328D|nr:MlaD family protein [Mycobacteroides abscessus]SHX53019.1 Mce family protein [Mycobacteroides abscessus subsp. bolletii]SKP62121.1 Mce family protein [Mycobacteroides abscessus subsp. bolletii]SKP73750.1 Mce family protein [Mycobacteroides abscessus subsp. bolletii]SKQ21106.1 Mce family protein [Mycobacteroides abscessus subsp. bolletii]